MRINACFDSHVHWAAVGEFAHRLRLEGLTSPAEILKVQPDKHHFRGEWLVGFGWDQNKWNEQPHRRYLDQWFPHTPVMLTRVDGHAVWVNSEALRRVGVIDESGRISGVHSKDILSGGRVETDENGAPSGVLVDRAMELVESVVPKDSDFDVRRNLLFAMKVFNDAGLTHIRDMTCDEQQWNQAVRLFDSGLLTLGVEEYFWLKELSDLEKSIATIQHAQKSAPPLLRPMGLKIFYDGALGSEGALISQCYHGQSHQGLRLWRDSDLMEVMTQVWKSNQALAIHAIGDLAVDSVIELALKVKAIGVSGALHIEHGELIQSKTIKKMRELDIHIHMQPAHWLSDRDWLQKKVGLLQECAFPWRRLQEERIDFDFGSDAPISSPSLAEIFRAIRESADAGIPRLLGGPESYLSYRDLGWIPNCYTLLEEDQPVQVVFQGEHLLG